MSACYSPASTPDLGPARTLRDDRVPGGVLVNLAGILKMAKEAGTPKAAAFHDAFSLAYERVAGLPMTETVKQQAALREALAVCGMPEPTFFEMAKQP